MMERYVDLFLDRLFKMAARVADKCYGAAQPELPQAPSMERPTPTIRFSHEDRMVEGELFK